MFGDASAVPAEQGVWCDEPSVAARSGECLGYRCEQAPIILGEVSSGVASVQDAELVTPDDDLDVFGPAGTYSEAGK